MATGKSHLTIDSLIKMHPILVGKEAFYYYLKIYLLYQQQVHNRNKAAAYNFNNYYKHNYNTLIPVTLLHYVMIVG